MRILKATKTLKLLCTHGSCLVLQVTGERSMQVDGKPVLVETDVLDAKVTTCQGIPPCTSITSILSGKAQEITVDGVAPLLETLVVMTDAGMAVVDPVSLEQATSRSAQVLLPVGGGLASKSDSTAAAPPASQEHKDDVEDEKKQEEQQREDQSWIYLRIIERHTQARVPNIQLSLKLADGQSFIAVSDNNGEIRRANVVKGSFTIEGITLEEMKKSPPEWEQLVGGPHKARADDKFKLEVKPIPAAQLKEEKEKAVQPISLPNELRPDGTVDVARIEAHRVKDNDTLDSLAKHHGTAWKVIAHYNWGKEGSESINASLRDEVGCTLMDQGNKNYRFSSKDVPGIIFIPIPWSQDDLKTGEHYLLQVELMPAYRFALEDDAGNPFPEIEYNIRFANEKEAQSHKLSPRGRGLHLGAPPGPVEVTYIDTDQIRTHWLARRLAFWIDTIRRESMPMDPMDPDNRIPMPASIPLSPLA